jgi:hypothetical protein
VFVPSYPHYSPTALNLSNRPRFSRRGILDCCGNPESIRGTPLWNERRKYFDRVTPSESAVAAALCRRTPRRFAFIHD